MAMGPLVVAWAAAACASSPPSAPAADRVFVSQAGSSTIVLVDAASGEMTARLEVGMLPHNLVLSPDRKTLYAALVGSQAVAEIDVASFRLRRTMLTAPVPERRSDGSMIDAHVERGAFSHTTCFDCHRAGGALPRYAGDRPFGLLLSPDGRRLLVSHLRSANLSVLDLDDGQIERTVHLLPAGAATEPVALARVGDRIWVALRPPQPSLQPGALRRLDAITLDAVDDVATGADPAALLALPEQERVLVSNFETDTVTAYLGTAAARFTAAPGPLGLLALPGHRVLALDYYSNGISFLDLDAGTAETLALAHEGAPYANPTHAALSTDGKSVWLVSSGTEGHLLRMDLATHAIVRDVPIDGLSFGVVVVAGSAREGPFVP
jgi:DNA-binding beta-propeller fold protein YncE